MKKCRYITLREESEIKEAAAEWFHNKWGVPTEAYLECMRCFYRREIPLPGDCRKFIKYGCE